MREGSYILVLALPPVLGPGSLALRRPLPLATGPEESARLRRVGERFVCVDLASESLVQCRHFDSSPKQSLNLSSLCLSARAGKSPRRVRPVCGNSWENSWEKQAVQAGIGIHVTYFGLTDAAAPQSPRCPPNH